jgi:pimeloyl-ACP methyl ester carboxylesterase
LDAEFALIHSPLVGPSTWLPVSDELRRLGRRSVIPRLRDIDDRDTPYWQQESESATTVLDQAAGERPLVLVGHSGAGTLLPLIGRETRRPVAGYIYVDAGLPLEGASRLAEMSENAPEFASRLRDELVRGNRAPNWSDDDLRPIIPDDGLRRRVIAELQPRPLAFYEEPIPSPADWASMPSGYILFSPTYSPAADRARQLGWPCYTLSGGHFHMLVDPGAVAAALISISDAWKS